MNDSWLFLIWRSDASPYSTNAALSRWPIAVLPASRYMMGADSSNLTVLAACYEITKSFNALSTGGVSIRDLNRSAVGLFLGSGLLAFELCCMFFFTPVGTLHFGARLAGPAGCKPEILGNGLSWGLESACASFCFPAPRSN